jgi:monofunctional biosynthetic peptidoglycan transglycosylase
MRRRRRGSHLARSALRWLGRGAIAATVLWTLGFAYLSWFRPLTTSVQMQRRLEALLQGAPYQKRYAFVPLKRISPNLQHAVVAAEDARFSEHDGVDWQAMEEAVRDNWRRRRLWRGGSTITQQLVKNLYLTAYRIAGRKVIEIPLALIAEVVLDKDRILELYLNVVEWGPGVYGAEAAAQYHYGLPAAALTREQAARLAACLPSPRTRRPQDMHRLGRLIERRMVRGAGAFSRAS